MVEKNNRTIQHWIQSAEYDLDTARGMLKIEKYLYVGFMCHITIEKMLKACFVKVIGTTPPYTHNLEKLAQQSGIYKELSKEQISLMAELEPMNIKARYPGEKHNILKEMTLGKCKNLISDTEELFLWLMKKLKEK